MAETPLKYRIAATAAWTLVCLVHALRFAIPVATQARVTTWAVRKAAAYIRAA